MQTMQKRKKSELTPLEASVKDRIHNGDTSWLPDGRSSLLESEATSAETGMEMLHTSLQNIQVQHDHLKEELKEDLRRIREELNPGKSPR
jgi:hypothetical protein